jgi:hypothetical protein
MMKRLKIAFQVIWAAAAIILCTAIGAIYGWEQHILMGAIALGFVGLCVGALIAASPMLVLQFLLRLLS